jgi:hypothetical protein
MCRAANGIDRTGSFTASERVVRELPTTRTAIAIALGLSVVAVTATQTERSPAVSGLDHVPVAVADLGSAASRYQQLGFTLKPGRPHANGITNQHAKFPDGTEIELITAPQAVDALTKTYRTHLARGQGPAFLSLYAPLESTLRADLDRAGLAYTRTSGLVVARPAHSLGYIFFGQRNRSPTDRPEHYVHRNTARSLIGVWLAAADFSAERRLFGAIGATFSEEVVLVPDRTTATVARFAEGTVVMLPPAHQIVPGHKIVGLTVAVANRETTKGVVGVLRYRSADEQDGRVFVAPAQALGYWLEFR